MSDRPILITGAGGFIGYHAAEALLSQGHEVVGFDNLNDYYTVELKKARLERLEAYKGFHFVRGDVASLPEIQAVFDEHKPEVVLHLAAQAGVRYSSERPDVFAQSNGLGFANILELSRRRDVKHFVYASSSSVYGANVKMPFSEKDSVDHPVSFYGALKRANELMAHSYSIQYGLPTTGLRFFTVYGPWGRPDMAPMLFAKAIAEGGEIRLFNQGNMKRDFTFVGDIVNGILAVLDHIPQGFESWSGLETDPARSTAPFRVFNIGRGAPVNLLDFVNILEREMGGQAVKVMMPLPPGEVIETWADITELSSAVGFKPSVSIEQGVAQFAAWYKEYCLQPSARIQL